MLVVPTAGAVILMNAMMKGPLGPSGLALYVNDYHPDLTSAIGDFVEASYPMYSRQLVSPAFTSTAPQMDGSALTSFPAAHFLTNTGSGQTLFGYFVVGPDLSTILWAERFTSPFPDGSILASLSIQLAIFGLSSFTG